MHDMCVRACACVRVRACVCVCVCVFLSTDLTRSVPGAWAVMFIVIIIILTNDYTIVMQPRLV